ncbi:MAG: HAD-IIB family hydrolase, partial [Selenomonas sp.]
WYIGDDIYAEDFRPEYFTAYRTVQGFAVHEVGEDFSPYVEGVAQVVVRDLAGGVGAIAASIRERFAGRVDPQQSKGYTLDLVPTGVSKATGIEAILRATGIRADEVMACGDSDNDLSMLRLAGTSVVTANGQEEAKALATYLAPSCDEDGVARAIEELVL